MSNEPTSPLPANVLVLDRPFAVEYSEAEDLEDKIGECIVHESRVRITNSATLRAEQQVVMHELIHAADEIMGSWLKETQVQQMAFVFCSLVRDNPHLVDYIRRDETT
jgi:hypothetical protein